jgi:hypothetical protein
VTVRGRAGAPLALVPIVAPIEMLTGTSDYRFCPD